MRLDFAQFDAHAADFHLIVVTPQIVQRAVCIPASQITGAVHTRLRVLAERIAEEAFGSELRLIQITSCQAFTADVQLAGNTGRHQLLLLIEQVHA
ncbi:hypothetical protein C5I_0111650, partial [Pseudomonas syringae pv. syringae FF5]